MTTCYGFARAALVAVAMVGAPCAGAQGTVNVAAMRGRLEAWRAGEHAKLRATGTATRGDFIAIDNAFRAQGQAMEPLRTSALRQLEAKAGLSRGALGQGPGGTNPALGEGILGDVDPGSLSGRQYDAAIRAARASGYTVRPKGDAVTIPELDLTLHRGRSAFRSPVGSSTGGIEAGRGGNKETDLNFGRNQRDGHVAVQQNLKKSAGTLTRRPADLLNRPGELQELGKMTMRNLADAQLSNPELQQQATMLKQRFSPEAAGVVPPNATPAEREAALAAFQRASRNVSTDAFRLTEAQAMAKAGALRQSASQAEGVFQEALRGGDRAAIDAARGHLVNARTQMIEYNELLAASQRNLVNSGSAARNIAAEAAGLRSAVVETPAGLRFSTPNGLATSSQLRDAVANRAWEATGTSLRGKLVGGTMVGLALAGAYHSLTTGAQQAGTEAAGGDRALTSIGKTGAYTAWEFFGVGPAIRGGTTLGEESAAQYAKDLEEGRVDPNSTWEYVYAHARAGGWWLARLTGAQDVKDIAVGYWEKRAAERQLAADEAAAAQALADDAKRNEARAAATREAARQESAKQEAAKQEAAKREAVRRESERTQQAEQDRIARARAEREQLDREAAAARTAQEGRERARKEARDAAARDSAAKAAADATSIMPNLVRTSWKGEVTIAPVGTEDPPVTFALTLSVDSYNKLDGSMEWIAWYDEDETPRRTLPLGGEYDGRTGRFSLRFDRPFRHESKVVQVMNVPLASGGSREERIEVVEVKLDHPRGELTGAVDGSTDARGTIEGTWTQGITVDGKAAGSGGHALRGTWRLRRVR